MGTHRDRPCLPGQVTAPAQRLQLLWLSVHRHPALLGDGTHSCERGRAQGVVEVTP